VFPVKVLGRVLLYFSEALLVLVSAAIEATVRRFVNVDMGLAGL
jgi:hypothetical protein